MYSFFKMYNEIIDLYVIALFLKIYGKLKLEIRRYEKPICRHNTEYNVQTFHVLTIKMYMVIQICLQLL